MRLEASAVRTYKDGIVASHLAGAAIAQAMRELASDWAFVNTDDEGDLVFYTRERLALPRPPRREVPFGPGHFTYRLRDEEALLNLNTAQPGRLEALLEGLGLKRADRELIADSIRDWRDTNEEHRLHGAESEDYYLKLPVPYRARNANLESVNELLQIRGVTPAIFHGAEGRPGLADLVTVRTAGQVNINTAPPLVLRALGLSTAEVSTVVQSRRDAPYTDLRQFGGRGVGFSSPPTTRTFRVHAEGILNGRVGARLTAVVRRNSPSEIVVVEWSGVQ
jgi:general secretion pathway protein K